jgi:hypothetical protein
VPLATTANLLDDIERSLPAIASGRRALNRKVATLERQAGFRGPIKGALNGRRVVGYAFLRETGDL